MIFSMRLGLSQIFDSLKKKNFSTYLLYGTSLGLMQGVLQDLQRMYRLEALMPDELDSYKEGILQPRLFSMETSPSLPYVGSWNKNVAEVAQDWPLQQPLFVLHEQNCPPGLLHSSSIAVIPCYDCSLQEAKIFLKRQKPYLTWCPDALEEAAKHCLDGDWKGLCDLMDLGHGDSRPITLEDVVNVTLNPQNPEFEWWLKPYLSQKEIGEIWIQEPLMSLKLWQRLLFQITQLRQNLKKENFWASGVKSITPPLFFKHQNFLKTYWDFWAVVDLSNLHQWLLEGEFAVKKDPSRALCHLHRILHKKNKLFLKMAPGPARLGHQTKD